MANTQRNATLDIAKGLCFCEKQFTEISDAIRLSLKINGKD
jgi:hypothetical protein